MTAPQPAPAAADARGVVVDAGALGLSALGEIRAVANTLGVCGSGTGATKMRQMATALRAACDALESATPAVPAPDRAAFIAALGTLARAAVADHESDYHGYPSGGDGLGAAYNALLALVFPDAPAPAPDAAGEAVRDG